SGRATKPAVKVRKDRICPENGSTLGKKSRGKARAAITPYRKKSYHSMVVPTVLAITASITALLPTGASAVVVGSIDPLISTGLTPRPALAGCGRRRRSTRARADASADPGIPHT